MKISLMTVADKIMLRKRAIGESVNEELEEYRSERTLKT